MKKQSLHGRIAVVVLVASIVLLATSRALPGAESRFFAATVNAAPQAESHSPTTITLPPPAQPLLAWSIAPDGTVYVLDAFLSVYALAPHTLTPLARSPRLRPTVSATPAAMTVDEAQVYLSGAALGETIVLARADLQVATTLSVALRKAPDWRHGATSLGVDPGRHLFLVGEGGRTASGYSRNALWAFDLTDLSQPPTLLIPAEVGEGVGFSEPRGVRVDPQTRRLYVTVFNAPGSSPRNSQNIHLFDLDTLTQIGFLRMGDNFRYDTLPALATKAGQLTIASSAVNGTAMLATFANHQLPLSDSTFAPLSDSAFTPLRTAPIASRQVAIDPQAEWLYLLEEQGIWVLRGNDFSLASIYPLVTAPPHELLLSPDGATLYLFGNGWQQGLATAEVQTLGIIPVAPFPDAWIPDPARPSPIYPSPQLDKDGTVLRPGGGAIFRSQDGGQSWLPLLDYTPTSAPNNADQMAANAHSFSLSPTFAEDQTLVAVNAGLLRSTDGGENWQGWAPRIAFTSDRSGNRDIFTANEQGGEIRQLTAHLASDETPAWSPAWTYVAFASDRNGNWDIYSIRADCTPQNAVEEAACDLQQLTDDPADDLLPAWSPDGRAIAFVSLRDGNPEIYIMANNGADQQRVTYDTHGDWRPVWLPTGMEIAFTSDRNGNNDILRQYVRQSGGLDFLPPDYFTVDNTLSLVKGPADERDAAITSTGRLLFWSDEGMSGNGGRIAALPNLFVGTYETSFYPVTTGLVGHPSGIPDLYNSSSALVSLETAGNVDIYHLTDQKAVPLITGPGFDGHPAGTPVWWEPTFAGW